MQPSINTNRKNCMTDPASLSPDERKRFYAELRQDDEYRKNRKTLISTTGMAALALLFVMLLVFKELIPMWMVLLDLIMIVGFYMYFAFRVARRQNEITERFKYYWGKTPKVKRKGKAKER